MRRAVLASVLLLGSTAAAEPELALSTRWPSTSEYRGLSLSDQITDRLTELGNTLGRHLDLLSADMFQLQVDGRSRRAHIHIGAGDEDTLLSFHLDAGIQFESVNANVDAHIDLGFDGHMLHLELPAFQVQPAEYRGDYGVQVEVPVFVQRF